MKLRWILLWTLVGLCCAIMGTSFYWEMAQQSKLRSLLAQRRQELAELDEKVQRAQERLEFFQTDEGQAWLARDRLNIAFPGERIYRIETPQNPALSEAAN